MTRITKKARISEMHDLLLGHGFIEIMTGKCGGSSVSMFQHPQLVAVEVQLRSTIDYFEILDGRLGRMCHKTGTSSEFKEALEKLLKPVPGC